MMSIQARESFRPITALNHPLRVYAANSPRAKARLIVIALLADGRLDEREIETLDRRGVFSDLGITREDFVQVLYDFCGDVAGQLSVGPGGYKLTAQALVGLFEEVDEHAARGLLLKHMAAVISSDGHLSDTEKSLFQSAINNWKPLAATKPRMPGPELHYG